MPTGPAIEGLLSPIPSELLLYRKNRKELEIRALVQFAHVKRTILWLSACAFRYALVRIVLPRAWAFGTVASSCLPLQVAGTGRPGFWIGFRWNVYGSCLSTRSPRRSTAERWAPIHSAMSRHGYTKAKKAHRMQTFFGVACCTVLYRTCPWCSFFRSIQLHLCHACHAK